MPKRCSICKQVFSVDQVLPRVDYLDLAKEEQEICRYCHNLFMTDYDYVKHWQDKGKSIISILNNISK